MDVIVKGPKDNLKVPVKSVGKLCFDVLKNADKDKILLSDSITGKFMTNGIFLEKCIKLSKALRDCGLKKGDTVSIISDNNVYFSVAIVAGLFSGIVVNALNPVYTIGELIPILNLTTPKIIFCNDEVLETIEQVSESIESVNEIILLSDNKDNKSSTKVKTVVQIIEDVVVDVTAFEPEEVDLENDPALIMCSSGTTGFPKGVVLTNKNIRITLVYFCDPNFGAASSQDRTLVLLPMYHVIGLLQIIISIYCNCFFVMNKIFKPQFFLEALEKYRITHISVVPIILQFIGTSDLVSKYDLSNLREIYCSGYSLNRSMEETIYQRLCNVKKVRQLYGLTEVCGGCTMQPISNPKPTGCGVLVHNFSAKICHLVTGKPLKMGETGEICVKGDGVMKEYLKNPEETKATFDDEGFFKTGDIGYFDQDQNLIIVDRLKELIKYKGFQVSPVEVESILCLHPGVKEAAVVGKPDERAGELPIAFVVKKDNSSVDEKEICDFVAERVSIQKRLHGGVQFVKNLPKSQSGKILRKILKDMIE